MTMYSPWETIILALTLFINFFLAIYVFYKNPHSNLHRIFSLFALGITGWATGVVLLFITQQFLFNNLVLGSGMVMIIGFILLSKIFPDNQRIEKRFYLYLVPLFLITPLVFSRLFIQDAAIDPSGALRPVNGPLFPLLVVVVGSYIVYSFALFLKKYRRLSGSSRLQMQYLFFGAVVFVAMMFFTNVFLPSINIFRFNALGPLSSIIFVGFASYAIIRHHLMDIRLVIQRGVVYSLLLFLIVGFYLTVIFILQTVFQRAANVPYFFSAGITAILGIFGVPPLERYFSRVTDKIFFKDKYEYSEALYTLSEILGQNLDLEVLARKMIDALKTILKVGQATVVLLPQRVLLGDSEKWQADDMRCLYNLLCAFERHPTILLRSEMDTWAEGAVPLKKIDLPRLKKAWALHGTEVVTPLVEKSTIIGAIVFGKKLSGDSFTDEDLQLLKTFSHQAAVALKKAELYQKIKDYSRELEERVHKRTAELEHIQEEQKQLMVDISHSLQTPLTVMMGELDSLKKRLRDPKKINEIKRSIGRVSKFTYDLLSLSKLETTRHGEEDKEIDLSGLLQGVVEYFTVLARHKGIFVTRHIEPGIVLKGDEKELETMITNLLSNAVKYMPGRKRKKIDIRLHKVAGHIDLAIQDSGMGISEKDVPYIFDRFYRVKHKGIETQGTGLGLAICKTIAEKHGGFIKVMSDPGKGATFTVQFKI